MEGFNQEEEKKHCNENTQGHVVITFSLHVKEIFSRPLWKYSLFQRSLDNVICCKSTIHCNWLVLIGDIGNIRI